MFLGVLKVNKKPSVFWLNIILKCFFPCSICIDFYAFLATERKSGLVDIQEIGDFIFHLINWLSAPFQVLESIMDPRTQVQNGMLTVLCLVLEQSTAPAPLSPNNVNLLLPVTTPTSNRFWAFAHLTFKLKDSMWLQNTGNFTFRHSG